MSISERRRMSRRVRVLCAACRERKARFRYRGEVRADRDHTLCFECYRGELDRQRARRLAQPPLPLDRAQAFESSPKLDERQMTHRQLMLEHLQGSRLRETHEVGCTRLTLVAKPNKKRA